MYSIIFFDHLTWSSRDIVNSIRNWFARFTWFIWKLYCIAIMNCLTTILLKSFRRKTSIVNRIFRDVCSFVCEIYAIITNEITWFRSKSLQTKQLINSFTIRCIHCFKFNYNFVVTIVSFNFNNISNALFRTMSQISTLKIKRVLTKWKFMKKLSINQTKWWWRKLRVTRSQKVYIISFVNKKWKFITMTSITLFLRSRVVFENISIVIFFLWYLKSSRNSHNIKSCRMFLLLIKTYRTKLFFTDLCAKRKLFFIRSWNLIANSSIAK